MKDKEMQITEMANISTKEEIEARNKRGKEKDELRQALLHYATAEASGGIKSLIDCEGCAFYLYENLGYRKLPEDSVVLSRKEYERITKELVTEQRATEIAKEYFEKIRKETAEKIYLQAKEIVDATKHIVQGIEYIHIDALKEIIKNCGVEIKE